MSNKEIFIVVKMLAWFPLLMMIKAVIENNVTLLVFFLAVLLLNLSAVWYVERLIRNRTK